MNSKILNSKPRIFGVVLSALYFDCMKHRSCCEEQKQKPRSKIIFLGTGSSTGCPRPLCPMVFSSDDTYKNSESLRDMKERMKSFCRVSNIASQGDPKLNPNYRNNPSLLIANYDSNEPKHIVIDTGKTFRETAIRWLPFYGITSLDAVILTHEHADATFGLDDVRGFQRWEKVDRSMSRGRPRQVPMPLYMSAECYGVVSRQFSWLFPERKTLVGDGKLVVERHVASFDVKIIEAFKPFNVQGMFITPLPVMHGEDLVSMGFAFSVGKLNIIYLSDISRMLPETLDFIKTRLPPTDILVIDALHPESPNPVHFNLDQAMEVAHHIRPQNTYLVGMNCDSYLPHDEMNEKLRELNGNVQLAHDGLAIEC